MKLRHLIALAILVVVCGCGGGGTGGGSGKITVPVPILNLIPPTEVTPAQFMAGGLRHIICLSNDNGVGGVFLVDADNNTQVTLFPFGTKMGMVVGNDLTRCFLFDRSVGKIYRYDVTTLTQKELVIEGLPTGNWHQRIVLDPSQSLLVVSTRAPGSSWPEVSIYSSSNGQLLVTLPAYTTLPSLSSNGRFAAWHNVAEGVIQRFDAATGQTVDIDVAATPRGVGGPYISSEHERYMPIMDNGELVVSSFTFAIGAVTHIQVDGTYKVIDGLQDYMGPVAIGNGVAYIYAQGNPVLGHAQLYQLNLTTDKLKNVQGSLPQLAMVRNGVFRVENNDAFVQAFAYYETGSFQRLSPDYTLSLTGDTAVSYAGYN